MNSYFIEISGSWIILTLSILISVLFSFYYYRTTVPKISKSKRLLLFILRSLSLSLLIFCLFSPVYNWLHSEGSKPKLAVLIDNSESMQLNDAKGNRKNDILDAIENSNFLSFENENLSVNLFADKVSEIDEFKTSNLNLDGKITNIDFGIKKVSKEIEDKNIEAILIISDGIYNYGNNPIYTSEKLGKPIFTISVGDSTAQKDIRIQTIISNDIVHKSSTIPININLETIGYQNQHIVLELSDDSKLIDKQEFDLSSNQQNISAIFNFHSDKAGVHKIQAKVNELDNEFSYKNNSINKYIEVIDSKKTISIFAGSPSTDLSFLINVLKENKDIDLKSFIQKNSNEFYFETPNEKDYLNSDIIILIGYPNSVTQEKYISRIKQELKNGKSLFLVSSREINYNKLRELEEFTPFNTISSNLNEFKVVPDYVTSSLGNPITKLLGNKDDIQIWNDLPPIFRTETFVKIKPGTEVLSYLKVNNVPLREPLILSRNNNLQRSIAFLGYGLYRWKLYGYAPQSMNGDNFDVYTQFINNSIQWLSTDHDKKLVKIYTNKQYYTESDKVEFIAQVYDENLNQINDATVELTLNNNDYNKSLILNSIGNGRYSLEIDDLKSGEYFYKGQANIYSKILGEDNGRFSVGKIDLEEQNLTTNTKLLREISEITGGKYYSPESSINFINDLYELPNFKSKPKTELSEIYIWRNPYLISIIILLLSIEWFIRKRSNLI